MSTIAKAVLRGRFFAGPEVDGVLQPAFLDGVRHRDCSGDRVRQDLSVPEG